MPSGDLLRYLFLSLVALVVLGFGLKWWKKGQDTKRIVAELRTYANPTASFEQFYAADAERALFKAMYQLHLGEERLEKPPHVMLDLALEKKSTGNLLGTHDPNGDYELDPRERLIRSAFLRNYDNCKRLGVFSGTIGREALAKGEAPQIHTGPNEGESVRIRYIIDPEVSPGAEKITPNLVISPPAPRSAKPNEFEIAQAKSLASDLQRAGLLETSARDRIIAHYDQVAREPDPDEADDAAKEAVPTP